VYESAAEPGGQFRMAAQVPGKAEFGETVRQRVRELADLGVPLHLGHHVGPGDVPMLRDLDGVIVATGVRPDRPRLPGVNLPHVLDYPQAFADPDALGAQVAIIGGGGIAVDLAHLLTGRVRAAVTAEGFLSAHALTASEVAAPAARPEPAPRQVTVMRRAGKIGTGIGASTRWVVMAELRDNGVRLLTGVRYRKITRGGVVIVDAEGDRRLIRADSVVLAAGQESERDVAAALRRAGIRFLAAGGAAGTGGLNAVRATAEGLRAAHRIITDGPVLPADHHCSADRPRSRETELLRAPR
jgi:2,4-dienoyl-CoA reductase (NADPH2)